ncbi:hypothetical protein BDA99DRAFT_529890 [Phascolomyces articulosus]|uniref:F-box/LRR-repeat protein 15-like leucin rich repeat domain-containing protein n=1 Tax=Phascolomyces articulosus TaxID=60185 RepID=A0AAD5JW40_9FUNG|nr:hypothetical protein BDA99DRAFT_529890 [Phascolomyces articulosus]
MAGHVSMTSPLDMVELVKMIIDLVDPDDLLNVAFTCRLFFSTACARMWTMLNPQTHVTLRRVRQTLEGRHSVNKQRMPFGDYRTLVNHFRWYPHDKGTMHFERQFFDVFEFPNLVRLEFSYAAAQDHAVQHIMQSSQRLRHVNLSHCYCLSTEAIRPLLDIPPSLKTLILYGCGKIDAYALAAVIRRHCQSLECIRLTDINNDILTAIQQCDKLQDLGLEHCSEALDSTCINQFAVHLMRQKIPRLTRIRMRDIANLNTEPMYYLARATTDTLVHLDMSECNLINQEEFTHLATLCQSLETLLLAHQFSVTDEVVQLFAQHCRKLKHLDVSGCRLLTDNAFNVWLDQGENNFSSMSPLETLNISGLEPDISPRVVLHLLQHLPHINEICLGVAYDYADATQLVKTASDFSLDTGRCVTICRTNWSTRSTSNPFT